MNTLTAVLTAALEGVRREAGEAREMMLVAAMMAIAVIVLITAVAFVIVG